MVGKTWVYRLSMAPFEASLPRVLISGSLGKVASAGFNKAGAIHTLLIYIYSILGRRELRMQGWSTIA